MFKILKKEKLNDSVSRILVDAPAIAKSAKPGQFVVVVPTENAERIPLTIADFDKKKGTISIIFQIVGATTKLLDSLKEGDSVSHLLGPLGVPTHVENIGTVVVIGGGVGIAEIYPAVKALTDAGNKVITIIGARNKDLLIYENELKAKSHALKITTDDGSYGRKGFVSDELKDIINSGEKISMVIAVGPVPMMKVCCEVTKPLGIKTHVSLNPLMLDATGMCGICRVTVGEKTGKIGHAYGMFLGGNKFYILKLKDENVVDTLITENKPRQWKHLDVTILHSLIIDRLLHIQRGTPESEQSVRYIKEEDRAIDAVKKGEAQIAFFLNATKIDEVVQIASKYEKMPPKSTFFYPKLLSGLVLNRIETDTKVDY